MAAWLWHRDVRYARYEMGLEYIKNQKDHHRKGTIHDRLERITSDDAKAAGEGQFHSKGI